MRLSLPPPLADELSSAIVISLVASKLLTFHPLQATRRHLTLHAIPSSILLSTAALAPRSPLSPMSHLYDLDGDGYYDTASYDGGAGYYDDPYAYSDVGGLGGGVYADYDGFSSGYGDVGGAGAYLGEPWGYGDAYPDLYDYTSFVEQPMGLYDAWGDDSWDQGQYALADLMVRPRPPFVLFELEEFVS